MKAELIDGIREAEKIKNNVKNEINSTGIKPGLGVILVGDDSASKLYVNKKEKACQEVGIYSETHTLPNDAKEEDVVEVLEKLNSNDKIHGILVQLPLPSHLNERKILHNISIKKDVDGLHPLSMGKLFMKESPVACCTPKGIIRLLDEYGIVIDGKDVVIINRSNIVGKPLAAMLLNRNATITICHSRTRDLAKHTKNADILITAIGKPGVITGDMVKENVVIIDAGTSKKEDKLMGDVDFESAKEKASFITPVPGGVGPMTIAMLMHNTILSAKSILKE
jgi:methylenetetrahydrofolate dehydrogenase (NADP+)/methenyltetrahydrofolate cyclohydrolase